MNSPSLRSRRRSRQAFSLVELLVVIAIVTALASLSGPAIRALSGAGSVHKAVADFSRTLEWGRAYAMAHNTYVRIAISELPAGSGRTNPALVALPLYSADGTSGGDMAQSGSWRHLAKPLILDNFVMNDALQGSSPDTSADHSPSSDTDMRTFSRQIVGSGPALTFKTFVQFSPTGEASVLASGSSRFIKIACDRPGSEAGKSPFILRISGANGNIGILLKEDIIL